MHGRGRAHAMAGALAAASYIVTPRSQWFVAMLPGATAANVYVRRLNHMHSTGWRGAYSGKVQPQCWHTPPPSLCAHRARTFISATGDNHVKARAASPSGETSSIVPNPYEWPSLENLGVMVPKLIGRRHEWWLRTTASDAEQPAVWTAYEKLDGTNVGMVASTGALVGRRFCIADDADTYQGVPLQPLRAQRDDVKELERAILELLPAKLTVGAQVVVYGELVISSDTFGNGSRAEPLQADEWYIFGAAVVPAEEQHAKDIKTQLMQKGFAALCVGAGHTFVYLNNIFEDLVQKACRGRLRTPPALCQPCSSVYELVPQVQPGLIGEAAGRTEGAVVVGVRDQLLVVSKWKTGQTDDSLSADRLDEALNSKVVTDGILDPEAVELLRLLYAVATLNRAIPHAKLAEQRAQAAPPEDPRLEAAFNSALTKIDDLTAWAARGDMRTAIAMITADVQADMAGDGVGMDQDEMDKLAAKVKAAVGKRMAQAKRAANKAQ